jgi:hypothetical protein
MRPPLICIFAFTLSLPTTSQITEVRENFAVGAKSIYAAALVSPQQGARYLDHPPTDEERSGDHGDGGCCDPHAASRTFFVIAFIFTVLAVFIARAGSGGLSWVGALPIALSSVAAGLLILGAVSLFSPSGGGAFADHPPTDEERSGDDTHEEDSIEFGACNTHHTIALVLAVIAFALTAFTVFRLRTNPNYSLAVPLLSMAAILELIVAATLLF